MPWIYVVLALVWGGMAYLLPPRIEDATMGNVFRWAGIFFLCFNLFRAYRTWSRQRSLKLRKQFDQEHSRVLDGEHSSAENTESNEGMDERR